MYSLRIYKTDEKGSFHQNTHLQKFEPISDHISVCKQVNVSNFDFLLHMFQVYPREDQENTFYTIREGTGLFVYCETKFGVYELKSSTQQKDNYLYFKPTTDTTNVYVVNAESPTRALDLLLQKEDK